MIKIQIEIKNKLYQLCWSDNITSLLKKIAISQQGIARWKDCLDLDLYLRDMNKCFESVPDNVFTKNLERIWQLEVDRIFKFINYDDKLSTSKTYLEIGSGISILGLLLSQVYPTIDFYFVDNNYVETLKNAPFYNDHHHAFYNSFDVIKNCIESSYIDNNRIHLFTPEDKWPSNIDIIVSLMSYCWHYGADNYLQNIETNLSNNGYLTLDVLHIGNNLDKITKKFGNPVLQFLYADKGTMIENAKYGVFDRSMINLDSPNPHGSRYMWIKKDI